MNGKGGTERGAAEERSGTPLTETEIRASQRPPSAGDRVAGNRPEKRADEYEIEPDEYEIETDEQR